MVVIVALEGALHYQEDLIGGPGWSRTNDVSNVTSLQPAAIATMLTDPYGDPTENRTPV